MLDLLPPSPSRAERPHCYRAFGLTIESDLALPELADGSGPPDVRIRLGPTPERLTSPTGRGVLFEASPGEYLLGVEDVARILVCSGCEITVDVSRNADAQRLRILLLGAAFTALLHQRGVLVLHAAGVVGARGTVLISGRSGHGKSTLVATLASRGYKVICDDAAAISLDSFGQLVVQPGIPQLSLWKDAATRLGLDVSELTAIRPDLEKYGYRGQTRFAMLAEPLAAVFVLSIGNCSEVSASIVPEGNRFEVLRENTRNLRVLNALRANAAHFQLAAAVAARVPLTFITRPRRRDSVAQVAALVEEMLQ